jgi:hypothetical protein
MRTTLINSGRLTLRQAGDILPGRPSVKTLRRWAKAGLCGGRVKLQLQCFNGRLYVSEDELFSFQMRIERAKSLRTPTTTNKQVDVVLSSFAL